MDNTPNTTRFEHWAGNGELYEAHATRHDDGWKCTLHHIDARARLRGAPYLEEIDSFHVDGTLGDAELACRTRIEQIASQ